MLCIPISSGSPVKRFWLRKRDLRFLTKKIICKFILYVLPEERNILGEMVQLVGGHVKDADAVLQTPHLQHAPTVVRMLRRTTHLLRNGCKPSVGKNQNSCLLSSFHLSIEQFIASTGTLTSQGGIKWNKTALTLKGGTGRKIRGYERMGRNKGS